MKNRRIILVVAIVLVLWVTYVFLKESKSSKPVELLNEATSSAEMTRVTYVVDGDTIEVEGGRRIRYIGIDTPELSKCFGDTAKGENSLLVSGKTVRLVRDVSETDTYGRLLRYVY